MVVNLFPREVGDRAIVKVNLANNPRCTTVKLNRPRSIDANVVKVPHPSPLSALDCLQRYNNIQFQMAYTRLIKILDRIAEPWYVSSTPVEHKN